MKLLGDVQVRIVGEEVPAWHSIGIRHAGTNSVARYALSGCSWC